MEKPIGKAWCLAGREAHTWRVVGRPGERYAPPSKIAVTSTSSMPTNMWVCQYENLSSNMGSPLCSV